MERFATGAWLDRRFIRFASGATLAGAVALIGFGLATRTGPYGTLDAWGRPLGTDFTLLWSAGRTVLEGRAAEVYDWALLAKAQQAAHGTEALGFWGWHYPPFFLTVAAALALLPYLPSLLVWQAATLAAALAVTRRILPDRDLLIAGLGFPAVYVCIVHGHNAFLTAALFAGGLLLLERRPLLAGALLGCLAYKPHFGLVIPLALAAGGYWRAILGGAVSVAALGLATVVLYGLDVWTAFFDTAHLTRTVVLEAGGPGWYKIQSLFAYARMAGGSLPLAYAAQGVVTASVAAAVAVLWWMKAPFRLRAATLMVGALLATPYLFDYDMVLLGPAIALAVAHGREHGFRRWEATALAVAWFMPVAARALTFFGNVPAGFLAIAVVFILLAGRGIREARGGSGLGELRPA